MDSIKDIIVRRNNDNNVNRYILNNDNNVNSSNGKKKYSLDKSKFTPNTEESQLAEDLANYFKDSENYAFYYSVVNSLGVLRAKEALKNIKDEIQQKENTKYAIRNPKKYFTWKYKKGFYR